MANPAITVVGVEYRKLSNQTPSLLDWGIMLGIPSDRTLRLVVDLADIVMCDTGLGQCPPSEVVFHHNDVLLDGIGYVLADYESAQLPGINVENAIEHYEAALLHAVDIFCRFLPPNACEITSVPGPIKTMLYVTVRHAPPRYL